MRIIRKCILFYFGGFAYFLLEILWRGRSYGSMFLLGGTCFLLIGEGNRRLTRLPLPVRLAAAATIVTALELLTGLLVNRDHQVWDYRQMPCNYLGQICLPYSLLWLPVSLMAMGLYTAAANAVEKMAADA
jgi:uncharacterized membrane protein